MLGAILAITILSAVYLVIGVSIGALLNMEFGWWASDRWTDESRWLAVVGFAVIFPVFIPVGLTYLVYSGVVRAPNGYRYVVRGFKDLFNPPNRVPKTPKIKLPKAQVSKSQEPRQRV